jgi:uncharacterized protein YxeA
MKKVLLNLLYIIVFTINTGVLLSLTVEQSQATPLVNKVTCYSTLGVWSPGMTQYTVYDCGPCTSVECSSYSDQSHCAHSSVAGVGTNY